MAGICNLMTYIFVRYLVKETNGNSITKNVAILLNKSPREVAQFVQQTSKISSSQEKKKLTDGEGAGEETQVS